MEQQVKAPGLKWRKLANGVSPVWVADEADVKNGYQPKTVNLSPIADQPDMLVARCNALQADMLLWRTGYRRDRLKFDGTVRSLLELYEAHARSPYQKLKPGSLRPYNHYLRQLKGHIGPIRIDDINGVDLIDWHDLWSENGKHLAAAAMARAVLSAAVAFGIMLRTPGCVELAGVIKETGKKLPAPRSRTASTTADMVIALRNAAHADGRPSSALAYALTFETTVRLWDVIGQWWPMDMGGISDVINPDRNEKWFGLKWENVDADLVLTFTPSKTADSTGRKVIYRLTNAPMVIEELQHWPVDRRQGAMIINEETGLPYLSAMFAKRFAKDRVTAGLDKSFWARDLRASGITEGRAADVSTDDAAKVAGHSSKRTTAKIYDRAVLQAADRFAEARLKGRERSGNGSGNAR